MSRWGEKGIHPPPFLALALGIVKVALILLGNLDQSQGDLETNEGCGVAQALYHGARDGREPRHQIIH